MLYLGIIIFILGTAVGSFLNAVIYRLREGKSLWGRSFCPSCKTKLEAIELIPIASFFALRGRCRNCSKKLSLQYPAVEFVTGVIFVLGYYKFADIKLASFWILASLLIIIFVYDLKYYLIPDKIVLLGVIVAFIYHAPQLFISFFAPLSLLFGVLVGGGFFLIQFLVSKGRWIGGGDIKLGFLMGLALGFPKILIAIFLSYIVGAIISLGLVLLRQKSFKSEIPFGPFLSGATIFMMLFGTEITNFILPFI